MAALNHSHPITSKPANSGEHISNMLSNAGWERQKSLVLRAWILSGLFFMTLPGTLLGFSNLMAISSRHGVGLLPAAWLEGHGHAQIFGWIGSFVLGIGFYSQPWRGRASARIPIVALALWATGVALRWAANIYGWHWRVLLPVSAGFELIAIGLFLRAASRHKMPARPGDEARGRAMEPWMAMVLLGTAGLAAAAAINFVECLRLALFSSQPAFSHTLDQKYLLLLGWGFIVPTVWGFSARWFAGLLLLREPDAAKLRLALALVVAALGCGIFGRMAPATILLALVTVVVVQALHLFQRPRRSAHMQKSYPGFSWFVRGAYLWLMTAAAMSIWAVYGDRHDGVWGASRHALTVGFAATMVFAIGPRILPYFAGVRAIFSARLAFLCLLLLQMGCTLRVASEPLAYEGFSSFAWKLLPVSGGMELGAVLLFALNLLLTFLGRASERTAVKPQPTALVNISLHRS